MSRQENLRLSLTNILEKKQEFNNCEVLISELKWDSLGNYSVVFSTLRLTQFIIGNKLFIFIKNSIKKSYRYLNLSSGSESIRRIISGGDTNLDRQGEEKGIIIFLLIGAVAATAVAWVAAKDILGELFKIHFLIYLLAS